MSRKGKAEILTFRCSRRDQKLLHALAEAQGRTVSEVLRGVSRKWIRDQLREELREGTATTLEEAEVA